MPYFHKPKLPYVILGGEKPCRKKQKKTRLTDMKFRGKHISILRDHFKWMDFYAVKSVNVLE